MDTLLTGVKTISLNNNLSVVPNPASKNISVSFVNATPGSLYLKLMNINGECVYTEKLNQSVVGKLEKTIDVTRFAKGIYNLQMITNSGVANKKKHLNF